MRGLRKAAWPAAVAAAAAAVLTLYIPYPAAKLRLDDSLSLRITDRNGAILRHVLSGAGGRSLRIGLDEISPHAVWATLAAEDRSFFLHRGLHWPSIARALARNIRSGAAAEGASTLTQQLIRNLEPAPRTIGTKLREAWLAVRLENGLTKAEILTQYLNRVPYGNLAHGIEAAARLYLDKPAALLSPAEAAFLAALPRSPSAGNPYRAPGRVEARRRAILRGMHAMGRLSADALERALAETIAVRRPDGPFEAPHFTDLVLSRLGPDPAPGTQTIRTTLDLGLQAKVERLLARRIDSLADRGLDNGAAVVLDNATGDVLALVGSRNYFDASRDGMVNGAVSPRQPGSALKPFVYALALEKGATAATLLSDEPEEFAAPGGTYAPRNYDREYHGPVRLRTALACSYNVPAVAAAASIGPGIVHARLLELGFAGLDRPASHYGVGLALGNGEVTLLELTNAYSAMAGRGLWRPENIVIDAGSVEDADLATDGPGGTGSAGIRRVTGARATGVLRVIDPHTPDGRRVIDERIAYLIADILADPAARAPAFGDGAPLRLPFPCAVKTGTSKDYRDNWAVGFTTAYTVGVWVGNFDGRPMHGVSGVTGCGPLFRDIMLTLHEDAPPRPRQEPAGLVRRTICPVSGALAGPECPGAMEEIFVAGTEPDTLCPVEHSQGRTKRASSAGPPGPLGPGDRSPAVESGRVRIVDPIDGAVFGLDPVLRPEYQAIRLRAAAPPGVRQIEWRVDGRPVGRAAPGASLRWRLTPGSFTITAAVASGETAGESRPVRITVVR